MKKLKVMFYAIVMILMINVCVYAADELQFEVNYQGTVVEDEAKPVTISLIGRAAPLYSKVKINVEIAGPSTPKLMAVDSSGNQLDIAQLGYWGPPTGFAVQGDFTNETPVTATFDKAGSYTITLNLVNLENASAILATKTITVNVQAKNTPVNNTITNNTTNEVTNLPQTGMSLTQYTICFAAIFLFALFLYRLKQKNNG